jgi:GNAT superfamily N-acetyltransferase
VYVRPMRRDDASAVARVHEAAARAGAAAAYPDPGAWVRDRDGADYYPALEDPTQTMYVATAGETVVGFGTAASGDGTVRAVYVDPAAQGEGVGSAILSRVEATLARAGHDVVRLTASVNAVGFYQAHGYEIVERTTLDEADTHFPVVEMRRELAGERSSGV